MAPKMLIPTYCVMIFSNLLKIFKCLCIVHTTKRMYAKQCIYLHFTLYVYLVLESTENTGSLLLALHMKVNPLCFLVNITETVQLLLFCCAISSSSSLIVMRDNVATGLLSEMHKKVTSVSSDTVVFVGILLERVVSEAASIIIYNNPLNKVSKYST